MNPGLIKEFSRKSNEEILKVISSLPSAYYRADVTGKIMAVNQKMVAIMGYSSVEEVLGMDLSQRYVDTDGRNAFLAKLAEAEGEIDDYVDQLYSKSGTPVWVSTSAHYVKNSKGEIQAVEGLVRDISKEKKIILGLESKQSLFELVVGNVNYGIAIHDTNGTCISANIRMMEILGTNADVIFGDSRSIYEKLAPEIVRIGLETDKELLAGGTIENRDFFLTQDKSTRFLNMTKLLLDTGSGRYICTILEDNTEQRKRGAITVQASKLAALGELSAGVAHELNQPLNVINLAVANLKRRGDKIDQDLLNSKLTMIENQVQRASKIVDQLRKFGRTTDEDAAEGDLVKAVQNTLLMFGQLLKDSNIEIRTCYDSQEISVPCAEIRLEQMCLNLLSNARDAINTRLTCASSDAAQKMSIEIKVSHTCNEATLTVADTGCGIDEAVADTLLDPFVTTKEVGKGTGLGLSVSQGFVTKAGGAIMLENTGQGALATVKLPLLQQEEYKGAQIVQ